MQYLVSAVVLAALSSILWAFLGRQKKTARIIHETIPGFNLRLSNSSGIIETLTLPADRIRCGFSPDFDIDLTGYIKTGRPTGKAPVEELSFQPADGRLAVTAHRKVMMNGVERTSGSIPMNGSLLFKSCRFTFLGSAELQIERSVYLGTPAIRKLAIAPALATLATMILVTLGLVDLGTSGYFQLPSPRPALVAEQATQAVTSPIAKPDPINPDPILHDPLVPAPIPEPARPTVVAPLRSAVRPEPIKPLPERIPSPTLTKQTMIGPPRIDPAQEPELQPAPVPESRLMPIPYPAPRMVSPGQPIPDERVDVLFIHAHPDDESIDFGTLMALCREAGLTTAMVLLTDGEGGIYQQDYTGPRDNIVSTRVQEAATAMQFLGPSLYIRLGLQNSPYNSLLEEKGITEVLRLWNEDALVAQLAGIINTLGPRVVVSPEEPSFAREHFEHEATGVLTRMALQHIRMHGGHIPEAHLVSIDPRQKDAYNSLIAFPRKRVLERQRQALLSHATQADATYFGVKIIETYSEEYYLIQYWNIAAHFSLFFGITAKLPEPTPGSTGSFLVYDDKKESSP